MKLSELKSVISVRNLAADHDLTKEVQDKLSNMGLLDPPSDGEFGAYSKQALARFQEILGVEEEGIGEQTAKALLGGKGISLILGDDLASRIVKYLREKNNYVAIGENYYNIVYLEGANADGVPNADRQNEWNDRRLVLEISSKGVPKIVGNYLATTEPGNYYTEHPMNPGGAARIAFGQYRAWCVGIHGNSEPHEALVQCGTIKVHRDKNKDGMRTGDAIDQGAGFGVNQHWGYDMANVGKASAGCLVGQSREKHREFMGILKKDKRYLLNGGYIFWTAVIAGDDLTKRFPG
jgi:hypothetical protein